MEFEKTIELKRSQGMNGNVIIRRPMAGELNKAKRLAGQQGKDDIERQLILQDTLLPYCIKSHPWGAIPVKEALNKLDFEDYEMVCQNLAGLMTQAQEEIKKKSEGSSEEQKA